MSRILETGPRVLRRFEDPPHQPARRYKLRAKRRQARCFQPALGDKQIAPDFG
jgi:hypothetical protein